MIKRFLVSGAVALSMLAFAPSASASTFTFGNCLGTGSSCGTVDVTQTPAQLLAGIVDVKVTLDPGVVFVNTGNGTNHPSFAFNSAAAVGGAFNVLEDGLNGIWTWVVTSGSFAVSGGGNFQFEYNCTTCNNGSSPPTNPGPFEFTITQAGLTPSSFTGNAHVPSNFFAADVLFRGNTGMVFAGLNPDVRGCTEDCEPPVPVVPEPASLVLLGTGLAMAAFGLRRKAAKS